MEAESVEVSPPQPKKLRPAHPAGEDGLPPPSTSVTRDAASLARVVSSFFNSSKHSDVLLNVGGATFPCHKLVLSGWSNVLEKMIIAKMSQESENGRQIEMNGLAGQLELTVDVLTGNVDCWREVLRFFYSAEIHLSSDNVFGIMEVAMRYEIDTLLNLCQTYLLASATYVNSCVYLERAKRLGLKGLEEKIKFLCFAQLEKALLTEGFRRLPFDVLKSWVTNDDMGISELVVFDAILSWVKADLPARKHLLTELLPLVRFPFLDSKTLASMKQRDDPLLQDPAITAILNPLLYEALLYNASPEAISEDEKAKVLRYRKRHELVVKFPFSRKIDTHTITRSGVYRIKAKGAKAADGKEQKGGKGAIITASFRLEEGTILHILVGGTSTMRDPDSGGGGGSFVAVGEVKLPLLVAGGGGGTRGKPGDFDGKDASLKEKGRSGAGAHKAAGGPKGKEGKTAKRSYGGGGGGFFGSGSGKSFLEGGDPGANGGFGGGGSVGNKGGGGGGGYSGGGGGQGGGGGGSFVRSDGFDIKKRIGSLTDGMVKVRFLGLC